MRMSRSIPAFARNFVFHYVCKSQTKARLAAGMAIGLHVIMPNRRNLSKAYWRNGAEKLAETKGRFFAENGATQDPLSKRGARGDLRPL